MQATRPETARPFESIDCSPAMITHAGHLDQRVAVGTWGGRATGKQAEMIDSDGAVHCQRTGKEKRDSSLLALPTLPTSQSSNPTPERQYDTTTAPGNTVV